MQSLHHIFIVTLALSFSRNSVAQFVPLPGQELFYLLCLARLPHTGAWSVGFGKQIVSNNNKK